LAYQGHFDIPYIDTLTLVLKLASYVSHPKKQEHVAELAKGFLFLPNDPLSWYIEQLWLLPNHFPRQLYRFSMKNIWQ
jgi:hypothetical protein